MQIFAFTHVQQIPMCQMWVKKEEKKRIFCASVNAALRPFLGPYDFRDAENADGIAESSHKNGIYSLTRNVTESESLHEHFTISFE